MKRIISFILCLVFSVSLFNISVFAKEEVRGVWVSTVTNLDFPSSKNLTASQQKKEIRQMFDEFDEMGINTVVFQVRPCGDALYESEINPWSEYLTGEQGKDPGYDPLEYAIKEAHKRGMSLHAWLNPYRVTMKGNADLNKLADNNPAKENPDWLIEYEGMITYNPEIDEVKELIRDTVKEIVRNYEVDGIHFDDYFYPSNYPLTQGDGNGSQANERREHVNEMIKMVSETIERYGDDVEFGVSPMGIWKNDIIDGYEIKGSQSYYTVFCDTVKWINEGWVDYVVPQIYWEDGHKTASYSKVAKWWNNIVEGTGVKLYIGEGIYKDTVAREMEDHFEICEEYKNIEGNIFFRASMLIDNFEGIGDLLRDYDKVKKDDKDFIEDFVVPEVPEIPKPEIKIEKKTALSTNAKVMVDGVDVKFDAYNIDGYNYFKLRDIAYAINGSEKQFNTLWDDVNKCITLETKSSYVPAGGELSKGNGKSKIAETSTALLMMDGKYIEAEAYNIDGMNYYKLRDIARVIDFAVVWSETHNSIGIFTMAGYEQ